MSYIHKALNKAQKERDARYKEYGGFLSARGKEKKFFLRRAVWWIPLIFIVTVLAFASYSWFDSRAQQLPATPEVRYGKPAQGNAQRRPVSPPARKKPAEVVVRKKHEATLVPNSEKIAKVANAKELYDKARAFYKSGRLQDAKRLYQETLKVDPGYVNALNNLGVIYIHEKDYREARIIFEKAMRLKPEYVDPYYNLACVYALEGAVTQSLAHLKRADSLDQAVRDWARRDTDLENLRGVFEFEEMIRFEGRK